MTFVRHRTRVVIDERGAPTRRPTPRWARTRCDFDDRRIRQLQPSVHRMFKTTGNEITDSARSANTRCSSTPTSESKQCGRWDDFEFPQDWQRQLAIGCEPGNSAVRQHTYGDSGRGRYSNSGVGTATLGRNLDVVHAKGSTTSESGPHPQLTSGDRQGAAVRCHRLQHRRPR